MHTITVDLVYFNYIKRKKKTIEGRINIGKYTTFKKNDLLKIVNGDKYIFVKIIKLKKYLSFEEYLSLEGLKRTLPNIKTIKDGVNIYYSFPNYKENEKKYGVLAIYMKKIFDSES